MARIAYKPINWPSLISSSSSIYPYSKPFISLWKLHAYSHSQIMPFFFLALKLNSTPFSTREPFLLLIQDLFCTLLFVNLSQKPLNRDQPSHLWVPTEFSHVSIVICPDPIAIFTDFMFSIISTISSLRTKVLFTLIPRPRPTDHAVV